MSRHEAAVAAYLGLGANIGNPLAQLQQAVLSLRQQPAVQVMGISSLYRSEPVGCGAQPDFFNAAVAIQTELEPKALLDLGQSLEMAAGRKPGPRNAPRELDVDLLLYAQEWVHTPTLEVPHPRFRLRAFVLVPLAEIAGDAVDPVTGQTVQELVQRVSQTGVVRTLGPEWAAEKMR